MAANPNRRYMSVAEFMAMARASQDNKYEYLDGEVRAMAGGTAAHSWLAINMVKLLDEQLQSGPCRVFNSDMWVKLSEKRYVLPDATVSCDVADGVGDNTYIESPHLIVEVLSPGTEKFDRGKKFAAYQELASVQEYVLVSSEYQKVEVFQRFGDGEWECRVYGPGQEVYLDSLDIRFTVQELYARTRVPVGDPEDY